MKKILLIIPYAGVGGIERLAFTFYNYYKKIGYDVKVIKIIKQKSDLFNFGNDELYLSNKDLFEMTLLKRFYFYFKSCFLLRKIIIKEGITHSISFGDMANLFSSLSFTNEYKIGSIHALKSIEFLNKNFLNKVFRMSYNTSYSNLNKVVCISQAIKTDLIENCNFKDKERLRVIYNPHDINEVVSKSKKIIPKDEQYLFDKKVIVFLGRFSVQKSIWHLIKAFSEIETKDVNLVLIGDGDETMTNFLKKLVLKLKLNDNVFFLGRKSNPYKYLVKADVLALSSYWEGTPNVIVEAIALNIPIVSSYCTDGIVEMMSIKTSNHENGMFYTESGVITPNLLKNTVSIPTDISIIEEELVLAKALDIILENKKYKELLTVNRSDLLEKYKLDVVSKLYLE